MKMDHEAVLRMVTVATPESMIEPFLKPFLSLVKAAEGCLPFEQKYLAEVRTFAVALLDCESNKAMQALVGEQLCGARYLICVIWVLVCQRKIFRMKKYRQKCFQRTVDRPFFCLATIALDALDQAKAKKRAS